MTSYSGEFGEILFKHRQVRCKKKHILPPQAATSPVFIRRRSASYGGTSKQGFRSLVKMSRLHFITPWQAVDLPPALKLRWTSLGHTQGRSPLRAGRAKHPGNHPKAQEVRGSRRKSTALKQQSEANRRFFAESSTFKAKKSEIRHSAPPEFGQKNGVADRTRTDGLLGHNQTL